ncbi:MAG TPA: FHA domain-containing protein [Thermoleophilaceae bacterium]
MDQSPVAPHMSTPAELKERIAAERTGAPFLVYRDGDGRQVIHALGDAAVTVGRRPDNDVALDWDEEVSRLHAQLEHIKGDWAVVDDGLSRNGSFVNGEPIKGRQRLRDGDRLCFGRTILVYRSPAADDAPSTAATASRTVVASLSETQRKVLVALCRPMAVSAFITPASNKEIADELFLSVDAVKAHLRVLFERFELTELPQNQKRTSLAAIALLNEIVLPRDL